MAKILVVDGDESYRFLLKTILNPLVQSGHEVIIPDKVTDVTELRSLLEQTSPDMLVTGWALPGTNALGLMEKSLELEIPVFVNTSTLPGEDRQLDGFINSHLGKIHRISEKTKPKNVLEAITSSLNERRSSKVEF